MALLEAIYVIEDELVPIFVIEDEFDPDQPRDRIGRWTETQESFDEEHDTHFQRVDEPKLQRREWHKRFGDMGPKEIYQRLFGNVPLDGKPDLELYDGGGFEYSAGITGGGHMLRTVSGTTAYHETFELPKSMQGNDIAKHILRDAVDTYQRIGVNKIKLDANVDVGSYAWAKYGFEPDAYGWQEVRREARARADYLVDKGFIAPDDHQRILNLTSGNTDRRNIWKIADDTTPVGTGQNQTTLGKALLMSGKRAVVTRGLGEHRSDQYWSGKLDFSDQAQMRRFNGYIRR